MHRLVWIASCTAATICLSITAHADLLDQRKQWDVLSLPTRTAADFTFSAEGGLTVNADAAVGFAYRSVPPILPDAPPALGWRWRIDKSIPAYDQFKTGTDDRALAVHLWFDDQTADSSLFGGLAELLGYPRITHVLTYVWGGDHPVGTLQSSPYFNTGRVMVLRSAKDQIGVWRAEQRTLRNDISQAFGSTISLAALRFIAISADTDDRSDHSIARIADLVWEQTDAGR
jgi:hypothetical protein